MAVPTDTLPPPLAHPSPTPEPDRIELIVSKRAETCPTCGAPLQEERQKRQEYDRICGCLAAAVYEEGCVVKAWVDALNAFGALLRNDLAPENESRNNVSIRGAWRDRSGERRRGASP